MFSLLQSHFSWTSNIKIIIHRNKISTHFFISLCLSDKQITSTTEYPSIILPHIVFTSSLESWGHIVSQNIPWTIFIAQSSDSHAGWRRSWYHNLTFCCFSKFDWTAMLEVRPGFLVVTTGICPVCCAQTQDVWTLGELLRLIYMLIYSMDATLSAWNQFMESFRFRLFWWRSETLKVR